MLCGLQLPGPGNQQLLFQGRVADADQSRCGRPGPVWGSTRRPTSPMTPPVDCSAPHAMEVTGAVDLGERFPDGLPAEGSGRVHQGGVHLVDRRLSRARRTARHHADTDLQHRLLPSWTAGSRPGVMQHRRDPGQWRLGHLINSAKGPLLISSQPPVPRRRSRRAAQPAASAIVAVPARLVPVRMAQSASTNWWPMPRPDPPDLAGRSTMWWFWWPTAIPRSQTCWGSTRVWH